MAKVDIDIVKAVLQRAEIDARKTAQIIDDINFESKARYKDDEKEPPCKKEFVVVYNPNAIDELSRGAAWILQIPKTDDPNEALQRLEAAARDFNLTPKGRRMPLKTVSEACEFCSKKILKEHKVWVRTAEPVLMLPTLGKISKGEE